MPTTTCKQCDYCITQDSEEGTEFLCMAMPPVLVAYPDGSESSVRGGYIDPDSISCIYWVPKLNARH